MGTWAAAVAGGAVMLLAHTGCGGATVPDAPTRGVVAEPDPVPEGAVPSDPSIEAEPRVLDYEVRSLEQGSLPAGSGTAVSSEGAVAVVPFASENELRRYTNRLTGLVRRRLAQERRRWRSVRRRRAPPREELQVSGVEQPPTSSEGITNTQVGGVDEGGIVKNLGDYLVVLRRGRLWTMRLGRAAGEMTPVAALSVSPPDDPHDAWYDEMLVHGPSSTIVVVGYSYDLRAAEIGLFGMDADGKLAHRDTFYLLSNDYYSSRNYASRLIGSRLVFYTPHHLVHAEWPPRPSLPAQRRGRGAWRSIIDASEVYRPARERDLFTLHAVTTCDLSLSPVSCETRGFLGAPGRGFYVSAEAVYVWVSGGWNRWIDDEDVDEGPLENHLYRIPLSGEKPSALRVAGMPTDQFSFDERDGRIRVLVRASGAGDGMWAPELSRGATALFEVDTDAFSDTIGVATRAAYRELPQPESEQPFHNRFIGDYVLYGAGSGWGHNAAPVDSHLYLHRVRGRDRRTYSIELPHGVDRLEAMAPGAVVIGSDGRALHFTSLELGDEPRPIDSHLQAGVGQGELRSHGFFYRAASATTGALGLPVRRSADPGSSHLVNGSAEVVFLGVDSLRFSPMGALGAHPEPANARCEFSCVDWYGNARPIFLFDRVFALLGYELVEGHVSAGAIREIGRANLSHALPRD